MVLTNDPDPLGGEWTCTNWDLLEKTSKTAYYIERFFQDVITRIPSP